MAAIEQKLVTIGDGSIGKTSLLIRFTRKEFPASYSPRFNENCVVDIEVDGKHVELSLWDTAGGEEFHRVRPLAYPGTNVFLLCFSIAEPDNFANISTYWIPEVRHHCPHAAVILCGNKLDLRNDEETIKELHKRNRKPVTKEEGFEMADTINAFAYLECSALTNEGVKEVFEAAVRAGFFIPPKKSRNLRCLLM